MEKVKKTLKLVKQSVDQELKGLRKLKGEKLATFKDIFNLEDDIDLYYNEYNVLIIDPILHENLKSFFKKDALLVKIEIPEHNVFCWIYQYFNDQIFESYLIDSTEYQP